MHHSRSYCSCYYCYGLIVIVPCLIVLVIIVTVLLLLLLHRYFIHSFSSLVARIGKLPGCLVEAVGSRGAAKS
jgi:hypothetical protein